MIGWVAAVMSGNVGQAILLVQAVVGIKLGGFNPKWGWRWGIAGQVPWLIFGFAIHKWIIWVQSILFAALYLHNLWQNRGREMRPKTAVPAQPGPADELVTS